MSKHRILISKAGIYIDEVSLYDGAFPVAVRFVVKSPRPWETKDFATELEARKYFEQLLAEAL